jgi:predicted acyl esterase
MRISLPGWRLAIRTVALFVAATAPAISQAPPKQPPVPHLTIMVPMRDGVKLATDVYRPEGSGSWPVILLRTPYNKSGISGMGADAIRRKYVLVAQDTRGRFASEGENLPFCGEGWAGHWDGYDTLEWLAQQPWCNGKIGTTGGSALGIAQLYEAGTGTNRLDCQEIIVGAPSMYQYMVFPGGVFKKSMVTDWTNACKFEPEGLKQWLSHPDYDSYWQDRDVTRRWGIVNAPAIHIGGWFDIFTQGTIDSFVGYQEHGGPRARGHQHLLIGPWTHGVFMEKAGDLKFPNGNRPPGDFSNSWMWFDAELKHASNGAESRPAVTYYVMGDTSDPAAPGNVWRTAHKWPPVTTRSVPYYLRPDHGLSTDRPASGEPLTYTYDPANPVPTDGGPQLTIPAGPRDQKPVEARTDVLLFTSEPLASPLEVTGRVHVRLSASSDAPDTDFTAKLCDVYPDGRSFNVCEGIMRARFRSGFGHEVLMKPNTVYTFDIDLASTSIIFNKGHRLRVQVTSSSDPGFDPNPNTGAPFRANGETRVAHNTIHLSGSNASCIMLPIPVQNTAAAR